MVVLDDRPVLRYAPPLGQHARRCDGCDARPYEPHAGGCPSAVCALCYRMLDRCSGAGRAHTRKEQ